MKKLVKQIIREFLNRRGYFHKDQIKINDYIIKQVLEQHITTKKLKVKTPYGKMTIPNYLSFLIAEENPIMYIK